MNQVGRYQILNELGRGATGIVYKALDPTIGRTLAIKSIRLSDLGASGPEGKRDLRERLLREAQSAGSLSHPNIVTIYDILETDDFAHILMEYIDGNSLQELLQRGAVPGYKELWQFLRQVADALDYAHRTGIIHRDIKPANILISKQQPDGSRVAKIADFGIARFVSHDPAQAGGMIGTPNYMSPEQIQGLAVTGASDQFALGTIVYELLAGERPFNAEALPSLFYQICKQNPKPVETANPSLNKTVGKVMNRVLAKDPQDRYASCSDFIGALSIALSESPGWSRSPAKPAAGETRAPAGVGVPIPAAPAILPETAAPAIAVAAVASASVAPRNLKTEPAPSVAPPPIIPPLPPPTPPRQSAPQQKSAPPPIVPPPPPPAEPRPNPDILSGWERRAQRNAQTRESRSGGKLWLIFALLAAVAIAALFIVRWNSASLLPLQTLGTKTGPTSPPPGDSDKPAQEKSHPPADLNPPPPAPAPEPAAPAPSSEKPLSPAPKADSAPVAPQPISPAQVGNIEPRKSEMPNHALSFVELVSDPPGAKIVIDSNPRQTCSAPCSLNLPGGRHALAAELNGYTLTRKIFNAPSRESIFVSLTKSMGVLVVTSIPAGSAVSIDGQNRGQTPLTLTLPSGSHHLTIINGAQRRHEETIEIDPDGMHTRSFRW